LGLAWVLVLAVGDLEAFWKSYGVDALDGDLEGRLTTGRAVIGLTTWGLAGAARGSY